MLVQKGFSLLELVITLAIAAIAVGVAAPSFSNMIQDNRLSSQSLDFIAALKLARSEAIKRRVRVALCKSADGLSCTANDNWEQGWIVFLDSDANNSRDIAANSPEIIFRVHNGLSGGNTLIGNANVDDFIVYTPLGNTTQIGTVSLCDPRNDNTKGRAIRINITGRAMLSSVSDARSVNARTEECSS